MQVYRRYIGIIPDNEEKYFQLLSAVIESIDKFSSMVIEKTPVSYQFRINPSESILIPSIIKEINKLNNLCNIRVEYSKSMKNSASVDFFVSLK